MDRMRTAVERHGDWSTDDERRDVRATRGRARAEYVRRAGEE
jgi:hypothetical protein